ncbi:MAG: hypothetical protein JZU65_07430 [Chlorobium sp.]|nr:hypothetical protein [Chlorobium sp.]
MLKNLTVFCAIADLREGLKSRFRLFKPSVKYVEAAARGIGQAMDGYRVIVDKSTVPIGTARKVQSWVSEELARRGVEQESL